MAIALVALLTWSVLAANEGVAAGTGIECGWQPMPDGSASYECVVQLEPALLSSLKRGDSIPLSVDVPDHIRPISRIRVVVGEDRVPHETLASDLKAWPEAEKKSRAGVVETQFTTNNADPRYSSQQGTNGAVVPLNDYMTNAQDAFARQLQAGGQAVQNAVGQVTQDVLPPDPGRSVANAVDRATQELGNNLRSASDSVQNDIRQMFGNAPPTATATEILPPGSQPTSVVSSSQQSQQILPGNATAAGSNRGRLDQAIGANPGTNWQSSQSPTSSTALGPPNNLATPELGDRYGSMASAAGTPGQILPQSSGMDRSDPLNSASRSQNSALPAADSRNSLGSSSQPAGSGPSFPPFTPSAGGQQSPITPTPMNASSTPEIRARMFDEPADAAIQGANGLPIGQQPLPAAQVASQAPPSQATPNASDFGWQTKPQTQQVATSPASAAPTTVFPLLLSWVLLSGSGAGNLYLFWSYLDVRNKYRDLVDDASRRISGRRIRD